MRMILDIYEISSNPDPVFRSDSTRPVKPDEYLSDHISATGRDCHFHFIFIFISLSSTCR